MKGWKDTCTPWRTLLQHGHRAYSERRYESAERYYRDAAQAAKESCGLVHPSVAECLSFLGYVLFHEERYAEAESVYTLALCAYEKSLGFLNAHVLMTLRKLRQIRHLRSEAAGSSKEAEQARHILCRNEENLYLLSEWKMRFALKHGDLMASQEIC